MARVKIKFPEQKPLASVQVPVRIGDINYGGHLGNDRVLSIIHEARMIALATQGFTELDAGGHGMIMADVMIAYRGESFYGDVLEVKIYADELTDRTFDLLYHVSTQRKGEMIEIAHAKTGMAAIDYSTRKIMDINTVLKSWLSGT